MWIVILRFRDGFGPQPQAHGPFANMWQVKRFLKEECDLLNWYEEVIALNPTVQVKEQYVIR